MNGHGAETDLAQIRANLAKAYETYLLARTRGDSSAARRHFLDYYRLKAIELLVGKGASVKRGVDGLLLGAAGEDHQVRAARRLLDALDQVIGPDGAAAASHADGFFEGVALGEAFVQFNLAAMGVIDQADAVDTKEAKAHEQRRRAAMAKAQLERATPARLEALQNARAHRRAHPASTQEEVVEAIRTKATRRLPKFSALIKWVRRWESAGEREGIPPRKK